MHPTHPGPVLFAPRDRAREHLPCLSLAVLTRPADQPIECADQLKAPHAIRLLPGERLTLLRILPRRTHGLCAHSAYRQAALLIDLHDLQKAET